MNWIARLDVIVLALMLAYVGVAVIYASYRCHLARRERGTDSASSRKLAAVLSIELGALKAIASSAPYLGLAGTCVGILDAFRPIGMEKHAALALISADVAVSLLTTAAGILVAVPATFACNYLRTRIDLLESELSADPPAQISRHRRVGVRYPLTERFSQLPAFALIAAPGLAVLVAVLTPYFAPREPTGFALELAPCWNGNDANDRITRLHITDSGKLLLNAEQEDWNGLASRLSEVYRVREQRTLDLVVDDGVPIQTVADALDLVENVSAAGPQAVGMEMDKLDIKVRLVTPRVWNARCPKL